MLRTDPNFLSPSKVIENLARPSAWPPPKPGTGAPEVLGGGAAGGCNNFLLSIERRKLFHPRLFLYVKPLPSSNSWFYNSLG